MNRTVFRTVFKAACTALWGPQYRSEAARQLKVHLRTVMRWDVGDTSIPQPALDQLDRLLGERATKINKLRSMMRRLRSKKRRVQGESK